LASLLACGVDSLLRLPERKIRKALGSLLPKSENFDVIVTWKRPAQRTPSQTAEEFALLPESVLVRVVRYTIAQRGFRTQRVTIVTTLLDASIPASDLADLYFRRWGIELNFCEIKIHFNMDVLRCLSPDMIERELRMHFIAYNLIRCVMQKAALTHDVDLARAPPSAGAG
jgi:IS4 transposase